MRRGKRNISYKADLLADLRNDSEFAAEYLSAAYADSRGAFLVALRDVVEATKGIGKVATRAKVDRVHLYRSLSETGNPTLNTLSGVLDAVGLKIVVVEKDAELPAPITATSAPAPAEQAGAVRISTNVAGSANDFGSAWTMTHVGNIAASTAALVVENKPSGEQLSDIPSVPLCLLAGQISERQEAAEQS